MFLFEEMASANVEIPQMYNSYTRKKSIFLQKYMHYIQSPLKILEHKAQCLCNNR